jgi:hypothetical protein
VNFVVIKISISAGQNTLIPFSKPTTSLDACGSNDTATGSIDALQKHYKEDYDCKNTTPIATFLSNDFVSDDEFAYCNSHNMILDRGDGWSTGMQSAETLKELDSLQYYSIHFPKISREPLFEHERLDTGIAVRYSKMGKARGHEQVITGTRGRTILLFADTVVILDHFRARRICDILNQYSHVIMVGNSMVRQLRQAILMAIRNRFYLGSSIE